MCNQCPPPSEANPTRRAVIQAGTAIGVTALMPASVLAADRSQPIAAVGYGKSSTDARLAPVRFTRAPLKHDEMLVDVLYCGVCHSDIHSAQKLDYLLVPGHEVVGRVSRLGTSVSKHKVGDLVGIGPILDSCRTCANCRAGQQQYCTNPAFTFTAGKGPGGGEPHFGGYANNIVVAEDYAIRIPSKMNPAAAAPLLCAGSTSWRPITAWKAGRGTRAGVIGMGGLGHLAVKYLADVGADVTVFTTTPAKAADARRFGATEVVTVGDHAAMKRLANSFDLLIGTLPVPWDMGAYAQLLRLDGTLVDVGLMPSEPAIQTVALAANERRLASSFAAGIGETQAMIDHCAERGIAADIEVLPVARANEAWERLAAKDVRYRFVLDMAALQA